MRTIPIVLAVVLTFAGCAVPADEQPAPRPAPRPAPELLMTPIALPMDLGGSEPNIAIHPDGTILVTAPSAFQGRSGALGPLAHLWRSTDDGETWQVVNGPSRNITDEPAPVDHPGAYTDCSCDADIVVAPDGTAYWTDWVFTGLAAGTFHVFRSDDSGATWTETTRPPAFPASQAVAPNVDRQWLVAGADGLVCMTYQDYTASGGAATAYREQMVTCSHDRGASWSLPVANVAYEPGTPFVTFPGHPFMAGETIVFPYGSITLPPGGDPLRAPTQIRIATSTDRGATWQTSLVADAPEGIVSLWPLQGAWDGSQLTLAWSAPDGDGVQIYVATHSGSAWSEPTPIGGPGTHLKPWVASRDGETAVVWYGTNATGSPDSMPPDTAWHIMGSRSAAGTFDPPQVVDPDPVQRGPISMDGDERALYEFPSAAFGPDGRLHVAYARQTEIEGSIPATIWHVATP